MTARIKAIEAKIAALPKGQPGTNGRDGQDGRPGVDGKDGERGKDGRDGIGIASASVDSNGNLTFVRTDGSRIAAGRIPVKGGDPVDLSPVTKRLAALESAVIPVQVLAPDGRVLDTDNYKMEKTADGWRFKPIKLRLIPKKR